MGDVTSMGAAMDRVLRRAQDSVCTPEELAAWEAGNEVEERRDRLDRSGITERLTAQGITALVTDQAKPTRALQFVQAWTLASRPMLVLLGDVGVGKTFGAAWVLTRKRGRYARAQELVEMLHGNAQQRELFWAHARTEVLVIDELGLERDEAEARITLHEIVDARQRLPRRTLLLGNLDAGQVVQRYDARTLDRMGIRSDDAGIALFRSLRGESIRGGL